MMFLMMLLTPCINTVQCLAIILTGGRTGGRFAGRGAATTSWSTSGSASAGGGGETSSSGVEEGY